MPNKFKALTAGLALIALPTLAAGAGQSHVMNHQGSHESHTEQGATTGQIPVQSPAEGGQSAFAALAEIVELLKNDPETDWKNVDIDGLREHLVDMNELTLNASAQTAVEGQYVVFTVSGEGRTRRAIVAMVPTHARVLNDTGRYKIEVEETTTGVTMRVKFESAAHLAQTKALGFFGIMASEAHHQAHHWQMAIGSSHSHQ